jgi:hypothetical protein
MSATPIKIQSTPKAYSEEQKKKFRSELKKMYEEEKKMVTGIFHCFEPRGGGVSFPFRKYPWDEAQQYAFLDGHQYTIPLAVARHLNGIDITAKALDGKIHTCSYPVHEHRQDSAGKASVEVGKRMRKYSFETLSGEWVA